MGFWVTIVTDAASLSHLVYDAIASNTFLVLGPIDLTNGRAGVVGSCPSTLRGIDTELRVKWLIRHFK
jgi:hypothetical protein